MHLRTKQGASTLTQQLSKILFTTREKIYSRKLFELFCAVELEKKFSKDEILLLYLNFVYFGHGCYGVENASVGLFGKSASGLSVVEAAHLVSVLANPSIFSPRLNPELSKKRHEMVMNLLVKEGVVSSSFAKREWVRHWQDIQSGYLSSVTSIWGMSLNRAPYFVEQVRRQLDRLFPSEEVQEGGYSVYTSLDLDLQDIADAKLGEGLQNLNRLFPSTTSEGRVEGAVVVLDCESGDVLASIGGSAFGVYNQLLRTTQIHRPIGSLVKPLVAALAFEKGVTADQEIEDKPLKIKIPGRNWEPKNYDRQFLVKVTLEQALIASRNIPFINLLSDLGPKPLIELIQNGSDASKERLPRNLSIALGACELSPLEVARLYALFPRGGKVLIPVDVKLIQKENGEIIFDQRDVAGVNTAESAGLFSKETAGSVSEILAKVISEPNGTANAAAKQVGFDLKAYGKTGTTQSYRDAWFAGFTRSLVAVVWVGVDRNIALEGASGGRVAAPIWLKMIKAMGDR
jgi:penicillin-binding protein 1A